MVGKIELTNSVAVGAWGDGKPRIELAGAGSFDEAQVRLEVFIQIDIVETGIQ